MPNNFGLGDIDQIMHILTIIKSPVKFFGAVL